VCPDRHKRKRLLFISTQFGIHAGAGSPFPVATPQSVSPYSGFFENIQVFIFNFY
jgi:hypothetical protein